jgi:hypothetical protein
MKHTFLSALPLLTLLIACGEEDTPRPACSTDAECAQETDGAVCDQLTKTCRAPAPAASRYIMVLDVSTDPKACEAVVGDVVGSGADITFVSLSGPRDLVGLGRAVAYTKGSGRVDNTDPDILKNMMISTFVGDECPDDGYSPATVLSLGCGGALFVEFIGRDGAAVTMSPELRVYVGEYGEVCDQREGELKDNYEVYLCDDAKEGELPDRGTCTTYLGGSKDGVNGWAIGMP